MKTTEKNALAAYVDRIDREWIMAKITVLKARLACDIAAAEKEKKYENTCFWERYGAVKALEAVGMKFERSELGRYLEVEYHELEMKF
uniref:Uncharacterized protein n=1 Tax=Siphoviridae sp. ctBCr48 TaxID=2827802 RepID=A0A8S5SHR0_9CAUD|nr:MAG TPA: hypothetical protein [Siphoviridae sp. ctBCr48]